MKYSEAFSQNVNKPIENVKKPKILPKNIVLWEILITFQRNETEDSSNPRLFRGLLELPGKLKKDLKHHFTKSHTFKELSKIIQNEFLYNFLQV